MTNRHWVVVFLLLAVVCTGIVLFQLCSDHGSVVNITQDGTVLYSIDLSNVTEPYELQVEYGQHYNSICVTPEGIYVREADCSNQVCVDHGMLQPSGAPITCLPHHLIISWAESWVDA